MNVSHTMAVFPLGLFDGSSLQIVAPSTPETLFLIPLCYMGIYVLLRNREPTRALSPPAPKITYDSLRLFLGHP